MAYAFNVFTKALDLATATPQELTTTASPTFSAVQTDTVTEKTTNSGVTVETILIKDNTIASDLAVSASVEIGSTSGEIIFPGDVTISGDLVVAGNTIQVNSEVTTTDRIVVVNSGEVGAGVTGGSAGIQIDRGSLIDYQFVFDEVNDLFRVGEIGTLQAVATREDVPVSTSVPFWDSTNTRFSSGGMRYNSSLSAYTIGYNAYSTTVGGANVVSKTNVWTDNGSEFYQQALHCAQDTVASLGATQVATRSRGTTATPAIVQNGDALGSWYILGHDGVDFAIGGYIACFVDATPGSGSMPSRFVFALSSTGSETPSEVLRLSSDRKATFSGTVVASTFTSTGGIQVTPASGNGVNFSLSTTGDFAVNSNQFYIDTSSGYIGFLNATPDKHLHIGNGDNGTSRYIKVQAGPSGGDIAGILFYVGGAVNASLQYDASNVDIKLINNYTGGATGVGRLVLGTNATGSFYITNTGYVGIGVAEPTEQLVTNGNLALPKTSGNGIKVDIASPTFAWADLLGQIVVKGSAGSTTPSWSAFRGSIYAYQFSVNDECWLVFHIPHDYAPGTDLYVHAHWAHNDAGVTSGSVTWGFDISYAKGWNQTAFPASSNFTVAQAASTTQYQHMIAEVQFSNNGGTGGNINTALIEPDGLVMIRTYLSANSINGTPEPFLHMVDLHYQTTSIGTKSRSPGFYT